MDKLKVIIQNHQMEFKIPTGIRMLVRRCCHAILLETEFEGSAEVGVTFADDAQIAQLNAKHRGINAPTDVLSFPLCQDGNYDVNPETGAKQLGDVVISVPRAVKQASEYGHPLQREIGYLTAHGILHLLGYDHVDNGLETVRMREKEEKVLTELGYPRSGSYVLEVDN
ncbi:MAG: rRNA maturation RNase YbeY [Oscillospiraceae bacterium]|jgi:probable rRNA maturation factor|nr:rRNA maturation RNase YbeY [Oscillospiraceae bacterium]